MLHVLKYYSRFVLVSLLLLLAGNSKAQETFVKTLMDTNHIVLGEQISLKYLVEQQAGEYIRMPLLVEFLTEGVEIIGEPTLDSSKTGKGTWEKSLDMSITSFDTGMYYLPPLPFLMEREGDVDTFLSKATYLEVFGVAIDTTHTIRDIKQPERIPVSPLNVALWMLGALLMIVAAYFIYRYYVGKDKAEAMFKPEKPREPAYITALRELDKLKAQKLWQQKKEKEYYSQITHVVRWYIEERYHVDALEQTSDQILEAPMLKILDKSLYANLQSLLNLADMVKFAKGEATPEENMQHLENAYDFVKQTRQDWADEAEADPGKK